MEYEGEAEVAVAPPSLLRRSYPFIRSLLQLALAGGLLAGLLWRVDLAAVRDDLRQADLWWLPLAFGMNLVSDWFRAIRWQHLMQPMRRLGVPFLFATAVIGVSSNMVLPFRAGEVIRVQVVRRRSGLSASSIVATLLSEKLMDVVAFSSFIVVGLLLFKEASFLWPLGVAYGALVVAGLAGARYLAGRVDRQQDAADDPAGSGRLRAWLAKELHGFAKGLQSFRSPRALFHVTWSSHAAWLCEATMYYACGRALGLDLSPAVYLLVVVAATIAVSVPITQAGLGVFELAITGLLVAFGVGESQAAAYAIFSHVMLALPYMASGPLAAFALRLSPADIFFLRAARPDGAEAPEREAAVSAARR